MMRLIVAGILVLWAGLAGASYTVDLDTGERLTVDSYEEDGGQTRLFQGGNEMTLPARRIRRIEEIDESGTWQSPEDEEARREIEARKLRVERHLLRVQAERFEADARGDDPREMKRLDREFKRTQRRRADVVRELQALDAE